MKANNIFQYALGTVIVVAFFVLLYILIKHEVPQANSGLLNLIVGALLTSFATVVGYFFGSSKGSAEKDEQIRKLNEPEKGFYNPDVK
jgi:hypothetical protein